MTEQALARAWFEQRNADAFRGICEEHSGMVYATALRMLRNAADAEDITQECFLRLARTSTGLHGSLGAWLHRVAVNLSIDHMRRNAARNARETTFVERTPTTTEVTWNDLREHVDAAINELPDQARDTIIAHFIQGVPQHVIADAEGVTRSAISQRINRALQSIRATLEKRGVTVSLTALTGLLTAHLAEAVAVPAGLTASLGNLAVYAGAAHAGAGMLSGILTAKGILAALLVLLTIGGAGIVTYRSSVTESEELDAIPIQDRADGDTSRPPDAAPITAADTATRQSATPAVESAADTPTAYAGAIVEGFVREPDSGQPLPGVYLVCQSDDGANRFRFDDDDRVYTDAEGRYRISGLAPGRYKLLCGSTWETRDPGDPQDYEVQLRFVRNESIHRFEVTGADAQAGPDFDAIVGETVSGFVVDDGKPVADADVMVHGSGTFVNVRTAANGWFKAGGFPVTDEVRAIAEKGRTRPGIRVEAIGEQEALSPETQTRVSSIAGPVTVTEDGLKNIRLELHPGASVTGVLTDDTGKPLVDVNVMARSNAKQYFGSRFAKTGAQGDFVLSGMAEGEYDLAWNPRNPGEDEHMYGWTPHEALVLKRIEVTWDQHLRGVQLRASAPDSQLGAETGWTLAGRVRDTRGNAVEGAVVRAWEMGHSGTAPQTKSDSDGRFELGDVNAGPLTMLRVEHPDFSTYMESLPEPVERSMDIVLEDRGTVSGQVRYADTGMPVTAFSVRMQKGNNQPVFVENEEGRFRIEGADAGENEVLISAEGYKETGTPVTVLPGREVAGIDARLERGLAVEGSVVDERGAPVEGAFLFAKRVPKIAAERETQLLAKTDVDGQFRVESLKDDYGVLSAWHADFGMGAARYDTSASGVEIVLRNNLGTVSGQVLLDGLPAVGAEVNLMATSLLSPEAAAFGTPNQFIKEDGSFRFEDVPEGEYNVSATMGHRNAIMPMGEKNLSRAILVQPGAETEVLLEFPVADASVAGRVLFQGKPVPQGFVVLTVESPEGKQTHMAQLDPDGAYVIAPIAAGHATLRSSAATATPFAGIARKLEFEIAPGDALIRNVEFNGQGTIGGTLSGAPAERQIPLMLVPASVDLSEPTLETVVVVSQEAVANAMTTGSGPFEFTAIPPGDYAVLAWLSHPSGKFDGYATAFCTVPEDGTPQTVTLHFQAP
ncbi:MAG: hypothetical protein AMXMBFR82_19620 [Candidatus Hydrogenedentota bacterium]